MGLKLIDTGKTLKFNNIEYKYEELLLKFVYADYTEVLNYIYEKSTECNKSAKTSLKNSFKKISKKLKFCTRKKYDFLHITSHHNGMCMYIRLFLKEIIHNNTFFNEKLFKDDPFFYLFIYEFFRLESNLDLSAKNLRYTYCEIEKVIKKLTNLQDLYYEAINICFNKSHIRLGKLNINTRLDYYSQLPYGINAISHLHANTISIITDNVKGINDNLFNNEENFLYDDMALLSTSTYVGIRQDKITYNSKEKQIIHSISDDMLSKYDIPFNAVTEELYNKTYKQKQYIKLEDFNSLLSLCSFLFFKMIVNNKNFCIQECKLCSRLFAKSPKSKKGYCDNLIFSDIKTYNEKKCSSANVGNKITLELKHNSDDLDSLYNRINTKLCARTYRNKHSSRERLALEDFRTLHKYYSNKSISSTKYELSLHYFDKLKPNTYIRENLPNNIKDILDKINKTPTVD